MGHLIMGLAKNDLGYWGIAYDPEWRVVELYHGKKRYARTLAHPVESVGGFNDFKRITTTKARRIFKDNKSIRHVAFVGWNGKNVYFVEHHRADPELILIHVYKRVD